MSTNSRILDVRCPKITKFFFKLLLIFFVKIVFFKKKLFKSTLASNKKNWYHKTLKKKKTFFKENISPHMLLRLKGGLIGSSNSQTHSSGSKNINYFLPLYNITYHFSLGFPSLTSVLSLAQQSSYLYNIKLGNLRLSKAFGSYSTLVSKGYLSSIKLPSGLVMLVKSHNSLFSFYPNTVSLKKKKILVRGIAKNPVDHPNGGNSNIKKPFKTPWGFIAKANK